ncbi:agmatinase [Candidatus Bathyarchaeota archaeon]|nr:agmatinase [Candidatus Bathyarchaeota archaeon]
MSYLKLYVSPSMPFSGYQKPFNEASYTILGVPFDYTSTYRTGARFAPTAIREASLNIETYSFRTGLDVEKIKIHDLGNLDVSANIDETLKRLELVTRELLEAKKTPIFIGGEHTITLGIVKALENTEKLAIISFDAHLDLRNEYLGLKTSHTTFMRRINEKIKPQKIIEVGTRAVCQEELEYAEKTGINYITSLEIQREGLEKTKEKLGRLLEGVENIYLSIDLDVLDPAYAPAVQNPEPEGIDPYTLHELIAEICKKSIIAFDLVEVTPNYDEGITAIQAAKTIFETICQIERNRKTC